MMFYSGDRSHFLVRQRSSLNNDARLFERSELFDLTEFRFLQTVYGANLVFDEFVHCEDYPQYCSARNLTEQAEDANKRSNE